MSARSDELTGQAAYAVETALAAGAGDAVASASWGRSLDFAWRGGQLEKVQESTSRSLGIALYVDGRFSTHGTNDLDRERLVGFIHEAVALTRALQPDPFRVIPDPALYEGRSEVDLDLVDSSLVSLTREERMAICARLEERAAAHDDVISVTSGIADGHGISARVSSNGFSGSRERTSLWYGAEVTMSEGDTKRPESHRWVGGLHRDGLPSPDEVGDEALRRCVTRLGASKVPSVRTTMVIDREAAAGFIGRIFGAMSARAIQQKQSFLADKLGQSIASSVLTLRDAPFIPRGMGSRLYDGEGISTTPRTIVENGVLQSYFVDTYYGRKMGWEPTSGSASNILFALGDTDRDGLLRGAQSGIYVESWLGGNANATTGDFSFGVRGRVIEGGELGAPVSEMNVTGNYLEILGRLSAVGNDPVPWSAFRAPTLVFDDVQFSGT
jgi:PmbA protein